MKQLHEELSYRQSIGWRPVTLRYIRESLAAIGYRLDRTMDCASLARYVSGDRAGESYPAMTTGIAQVDDGIPACNIEARRDANFAKLQAVRLELYAVVRGHIFEL